MPADAPHQVLEEDADLGARRRLAGAQENRHRLAALHMVDVHRQEAPRVVMGVEQRELLLAVHRVAGVVDVERDRRGRAREGAAEDIDQGNAERLVIIFRHELIDLKIVHSAIRAVRQRCIGGKKGIVEGC